MREISTVNMEHDGAESIQWNWKDFVLRLIRAMDDTKENPYNGIERHDGLQLWQGYHGYEESIQWNWKASRRASVSRGGWRWIHTMELKGFKTLPAPLCWGGLGIHTMELKDMLNDDIDSWFVPDIVGIHTMELKELPSAHPIPNSD